MTGTEARPTPYELAFGTGDFESVRFPAIAEEAEQRGTRADSPDKFLMLGAAGTLLRELLPADASGGAQLHEIGRLLYHAFHFSRSGRKLLPLDAAAVRTLLDAPPHVGVWELLPPHPAGYLQLPRHLVWARIEPESVAEPVDGFFWTMLGRDDVAAPPYARLDVLLVLGLRAGRPGFSVIPVEAELSGDAPGHWADADARPEGRDFENVLPGGELRGLYSLVTPLEVLKLASLCFWHAATRRA